MRLLAFFLFVCLSLTASAQQVNLTSFQHDLRWLDDIRFPPFVKDTAISRAIMTDAAAAISKKYNAESRSIPAQIDYKFVKAMGKSKMKPPVSSTNNDYQASIFSVIYKDTRDDVFWELKTEIQQGGKSIYSKETKHQLLDYEQNVNWFTDTSFVRTFHMLIEELFELREPLAQRYVLGKGIDQAALIREEGQYWDIDKNANPGASGLPVFGPYKTLSAGKLDSPVIRSRMQSGGDGALSYSGGSGLTYEQSKTIYTSKEKVYYLQLETGNDTLDAVFRVTVNTTQAQEYTSRPSKNAESNTTYGIPSTDRSIFGMFRTDTTTWDFQILGIGGGSMIGNLSNGREKLKFRSEAVRTLRYEEIILNEAGEYLAIKESGGKDPKMIIRKDLDPQTRDAIATFYAVLMSTPGVS